MKFNKLQKERIYRAVKLGDIRRIFNDLQIKYEERKHNDLWFKCTNPSHKDTEPSTHICADRLSYHHGIYNCFGCHDSGNIIMLVRAYLNISFWEAVHWIEARFYSDENVLPVRQDIDVTPSIPPNFEYYENQEEWNPPYLEYLFDRGITWKQIIRHKIGYCDSGKYSRRIIIPVLLNGILRTWIGRSIHGGKRVTSCPHGKIGLFGSELANPKKGPAILSEGWADALAIERLEFMNSMSLQTNILHEEQFAYIKRFEFTIIVPDGDSGGKRLIDSIAPYIDQHEFLIAELPPEEDPASLSIKPHGESILSAAIQSAKEWNPIIDKRIIEYIF